MLLCEPHVSDGLLNSGRAACGSLRGTSRIGVIDGQRLLDFDGEPGRRHCNITIGRGIGDERDTRRRDDRLELMSTL